MSETAGGRGRRGRRPVNCNPVIPKDFENLTETLAAFAAIASI